MNEKRIKACVSWFESGSYKRMPLLPAVSHSVGAHTDTPRRVDQRRRRSAIATTLPGPAAATRTTSTSPASGDTVSCRQLLRDVSDRAVYCQQRSSSEPIAYRLFDRLAYLYNLYSLFSCVASTRNYLG